MIILRQGNFSINYKQLFPRVDKNLSFDIEGTLPENIVKSILKDWKNTIVKNIWSYELEVGKNELKKNNLKEQDFADGLQLFEVSYGVWNDDTIELTFSAAKNTKLYDIYSSDFFWCLSFSGKTGKFIDLLAGD